MQVLYLCLYLIYKKTSMDLNKKHLLYLIVFFRVSRNLVGIRI